MVKRFCPKCKMGFDRKCNYEYHINRKYDCTPKSNDVDDFDDEKTENLNIFKNSQEFSEFLINSQKSKKNQKIKQENSKNNVILTESDNSNILNFDLENSKNLTGLLISNNNLSNLINPINSNNSSSFYCSYCNKCYSSKYNLSRHINDSCKIKKDRDNEKENIFKLLLKKDKKNKENKERIEKLEKQNKILMDKIDKLINIKSNPKSSKTINNNQKITNNIQNNNTQNNQIIMVNFGKEDLSIIDEKLFIDRIVKKPLLSGVKIPDEVLKLIHFNDMYPQLSNIYISDINRDKCMVFEDNEWKLSNIDNIPQIMDKICIFSTDQINIIRDKYPNNKPLNDRLNTIEKYNNMIDNDYLEDLKDDEDNQNKVLIKRCKDFQKLTYSTLKKTLYNEGKKIKKTIKTSH